MYFGRIINRISLINLGMNVNRCFICDQPLKKLSMEHFHTKRCLSKLRKLRCEDDDPAFGMWKDAILYICFFISSYNYKSRIKTIEFNQQYVLYMEFLHFE